MSPLRNSTFSDAGFALIVARQVEHLVGHVEPVNLSRRADTARGQQHVDAAAGPEVEDGLALVQIDERRRVAASERRVDRLFREPGGLFLLVQVAGDGVVRRTARGPQHAPPPVLTPDASLSVFLLNRLLNVVTLLPSLSSCRIYKYSPTHIYVKQEYTRGMKDARLATLEEAFKAFADPDAVEDSWVACRRRDLRVQHPRVSRHSAADGVSPPGVSRGRKAWCVTRKDGLWVHYKLAPLDEPVMRVLMSAVTHVLCHCDAISKDRQRLETQTGCCVPASRRNSNVACRTKSSEARKTAAAGDRRKRS